VSAVERTDDLPLPLFAVLEVAGEERCRICRLESVSRQKRLWLEREQTLERRQIRDQIAAAAGVNHHARVRGDEIAREYRAARLMPKGHVIRRVSGRMQGDNRVGADGNALALGEPLPSDGVLTIFFRPRILRDC